MEDKLTQEEQALFDSLSKKKLPPKHLEAKIIKELKSKNLLNDRKMETNSKKSWAIGIAASLMFFIGGYLIGNTGESATSEISAGYILLLHEDEHFQPEGSEMAVFAEYAAWMGKMMLKGINITGKELSPETTAWVAGANESAINYGKDKISGYFIIDVVDEKEAESIALTSPHIKYGGTVELIKLSDRN